MCHGWFGGNTTGDYEAALRASTNAIASLEAVVAESPTNRIFNKLAYAEQCCGLINLGLLRYEEAIRHFERQIYWADRMNTSAADNSSQAVDGNARRFAPGNIGEMLVRLGRERE